MKNSKSSSTLNHSVSGFVDKKMPILLVLLAVLLASTGPPVFGYIAKTHEKSFFVIHSFAGQFLCLGGFFLAIFALRKGEMRNTFKYELRRCISDLPIFTFCVAYSLVQIAFYSTYMIAIVLGSTAEASVYARIATPLIVVGSMIFFQFDARIERRMLFGWSILLCIAGIIFLQDPDPGQIFGPVIVVGLAIIVFSTAKTLIARKLTGKKEAIIDDRAYQTGMYQMNNSFVASVLMLVAGILYLIIVSVFYGAVYIPDLRSAALLGYVGFFTVVVPSATEVYVSNRWSGMVKISILNMLNPIFVATLSFFLIDERLSMSAYVFGIGLSLLGVYLSSRCVSEIK